MTCNENVLNIILCVNYITLAIIPSWALAIVHTSFFSAEPVPQVPASCEERG